MMKESLIFFALLFFVLIGFFQGFIGMDQVDAQTDKTSFILSSMANAIMSSPDFTGFDNFAPPFGLVLFYLFTFVIMVVLLNILIALYNSSYEDISSNSTDEYMALFAHKCLQFVRAPDEHVYIAPFNLIEIIGLVIPFEWWVTKPNYERLNSVVMGIIYAPLLCVTALLEQRDASNVVWNRKRGEEDDDTVQEWEVLDWKPDMEANARIESEERRERAGDKEWCALVEETSPDPSKNPVLEEVKTLRGEVKELREKLMKAENDQDQPPSPTKGP